MIEQETQAKPLSDSDHRKQLAVLTRYTWEGKGDNWARPYSTSSQEAVWEVGWDLLREVWGFTVFKYLQWHCQHLSSAILQSTVWLPPFDEGKLLKELNDKFSVRRELEMADDQLNLKYREYMAIASSALITAKNINFAKAVVEEPDTFMWKQTEWPTK